MWFAQVCMLCHHVSLHASKYISLRRPIPTEHRMTRVIIIGSKCLHLEIAVICQIPQPCNPKHRTLAFIRKKYFLLRNSSWSLCKGQSAYSIFSQQEETDSLFVLWIVNEWIQWMDSRKHRGLIPFISVNLSWTCLNPTLPAQRQG